MEKHLAYVSVRNEISPPSIDWGIIESVGVAFTPKKSPYRRTMSEKVNPDRVFVTSMEGFCPPGSELRFGKEVSEQTICSRGGIGRHVALKMLCREV